MFGGAPQAACWAGLRTCVSFLVRSDTTLQRRCGDQQKATCVHSPDQCALAAANESTNDATSSQDAGLSPLVAVRAEAINQSVLYGEPERTVDLDEDSGSNESDASDDDVSWLDSHEQRLRILIAHVRARLAERPPSYAIGLPPQLVPVPEVWNDVWSLLPFTTQAAVCGTCSSAIAWARTCSQWDEHMLVSLRAVLDQACVSLTGAPGVVDGDDEPFVCAGGCRRSDDDITPFVLRHARHSRTLEDVLGTMLRRRESAQLRASREAKEFARSLSGRRFSKKMEELRKRAEPDEEAWRKSFAPVATPKQPLWREGPPLVFESWGGFQGEVKSRRSDWALPTRSLSDFGIHEVTARSSDSPRLSMVETRPVRPRAATSLQSMRPTPRRNSHVEMRSLIEPSLQDAIPAAAAIFHEVAM